MMRFCPGTTVPPLNWDLICSPEWPPLGSSLIVQLDHRKRCQLIFTCHNVHGNRTLNSASIPIPNLEPDSIAPVISMNIFEFACSRHNAPRLADGGLNIFGGDYAAIAALNNDIVGDIWKWGRNCPDEGMVMGVILCPCMALAVSMSNSRGKVNLGYDH